eukprot:785364-Prymnesium_polylepis.1
MPRWSVLCVVRPSSATSSRVMSQAGKILLRRQPRRAPKIVIGSIISATSYAISGFRPLGCSRGPLEMRLAIAPPRIVTFESGVASWGEKAKRRMKSGSSRPPPPMPPPAATAHAKKTSAKPAQSRASMPSVSDLCAQMWSLEPYSCQQTCSGASSAHIQSSRHSVHTFCRGKL